MARKVITKRTDGRYRRTLSYEDPVTGAPRRANVYGKTVAEVTAREKEARARLEEGAPVRDASRALSAWLDEWRRTALAASDRADSTKALYVTLSTRHIEPTLGQVPLGKIRPVDVSRLMLTLKDKGLAASTVRNIYACLRAALDDAVVNGLIATNPATKVKRPAQARSEARALSPSQVRALIAAAETPSKYRPGHRLTCHGRAMRVMAATGLRRGELLGLRWSDVDLEKGEARVTATLGRSAGTLRLSDTKTATSVRTVILSDSALATLKAQRQAQREDKIRAANIWEETGYVWTTETGQPIDPRNFLRTVSRAAKAAGLDDVSVHTLRHTFATTALDAGVPIHVVSRNLGHSSIAITVDTYGHVSDDASRDAARRVSDALGF